jgi:Fe-S cluster assembly protein SufD
MSVGATLLETFRAKGIPHRRMEDWKYTDLRQVLDVDALANAPRVWVNEEAPDAVETIDDTADIWPAWASERLKAAHSPSVMEAAAGAFTHRKLAFRVPAGVKVEQPLTLHFNSAGQGQILVYVERGASLELVETDFVDATGLRNIALSIVLDEGAQLLHIREMHFNEALVAVETISVSMARNAKYNARFLNAGAKLSRTEVNITLAGEGAEADLSGVSVLGDKAHADITTRIDHAVANTTSRQLFKKVAGGKSRAVYQGKIIVREGAIHSDSRQTAKALLLGNQAEADLKPELEILADDVKCAHGAAVGDLDQDSLFYLRARGIPEAEARALLMEAFLQEVVDGIEDEGMRGIATEFVQANLASAVRATP